MDIIERIDKIVEILNKHPNLHMIDSDDTKKGWHVKVELKPGKTKTKEDYHAD